MYSSIAVVKIHDNSFAMLHMHGIMAGLPVSRLAACMGLGLFKHHSTLPANLCRTLCDLINTALAVCNFIQPCVYTIVHTVGSDLSGIYLSGNLIYPTEDWGTNVLHTIV